MRKKKNKINKTKYGYYFILPYFIVFLIFSLYPMVYTFYVSFHKWDGLAPQKFVGFQNFIRLVTDRIFYLSIWNTARIWICNFIPQMLIALIVAGIFTLNKIKGMGLFKAVYYLPNLITAASIGLLFNLLFDGNNSVANQILMKLGVDGAPFMFFNSTAFASGVVSYIQWWMWFGYTIVIIVSGITTIDTEIYEAAMVDGATKIQTYFRITLPLIKPTMVYLMLTSIIGGMQLFDLPNTLTDGEGNPQKSILSVSMYIYNQAFKNHNFGYASSVSVGLFVITVILCILALKVMNGKGDKND